MRLHTIRPYRFWHHPHLFREAPGGLEMENLVHYSLPFGPLGRGVNVLVMDRQMRKIFEFRRLFLDRSFGADPSPGTKRR
jgi:ligand-binding SRPBCC domain-containing protein